MAYNQYFCKNRIIVVSHLQNVWQAFDYVSVIHLITGETAKCNIFGKIFVMFLQVIT